MKQLEQKFEQKFEEALLGLVEHDLDVALSVVTGAFVGVMCAILKSRGLDPDKEVTVEGGLSRNITIHAVKDKPETGE